MYAIAEDRNRQFKLTPGESVLLDFNESWSPGDEIVLDKVCLVGGDGSQGGGAQIGAPYVAGVSVVLEVEGEQAGDKVYIGKYKRRKNYRRRTGFRARYVRAMVKEIRS